LFDVLLPVWAAMSPGNDQSAGKRRSGRTTKGDRWLRQTLTQAAWAASHTKETNLAAQYHRLAVRRGKKRARVALGHTLLTIVYHVLKQQTTYVELGADYLVSLARSNATISGLPVRWNLPCTPATGVAPCVVENRFP
jgi:hypothetical protein